MFFYIFILFCVVCRHVRLRGACRKAWGFESPPEQFFSPTKPPQSFTRLVLRAFRWFLKIQHSVKPFHLPALKQRQG